VMVASPGARRPAARATESASRWHRFWGGFPSVIRRTRKDRLSAALPKRSKPFSAPPKSGIQDARATERLCGAPMRRTCCRVFPWAMANNPLNKPAASRTGFHALLSPGGSRSSARQRFSCSLSATVKVIRRQRLTLAILAGDTIRESPSKSLPQCHARLRPWRDRSSGRTVTVSGRAGLGIGSRIRTSRTGVQRENWSGTGRAGRSSSPARV
jgi:hypothetical protein